MGDEYYYMDKLFMLTHLDLTVFPNGAQPHLMQSNLNPNMNDDGLRYYHLWDDNSGSGTTKPNRVGKVFS